MKNEETKKILDKDPAVGEELRKGGVRGFRAGLWKAVKLCEEYAQKHAKDDTFSKARAWQVLQSAMVIKEFMDSLDDESTEIAAAPTPPAQVTTRDILVEDLKNYRHPAPPAQGDVERLNWLLKNIDPVELDAILPRPVATFDEARSAIDEALATERKP